MHLNSDSAPTCTNQLANETSPYLLQHAHDPVDWYPWGPEALEKARAERKPIHLSVGYLACHWCHVTHKESFSDESTARLLNDNFVNIKVDREERPDIDRIYQMAQQMLTQRSGGWPLTMFLAHDDQRPFFGGTYFPKEARYGLPAFKDILQRVAQYLPRKARGPAHPERGADRSLCRDEPAAGRAGSGTHRRATACGPGAVRAYLRCRRTAASAAHRSSRSRRCAQRLLRDWRATVDDPEPDLRRCTW